MFMKKHSGKLSKLSIFIVLLLVTTQCANKSAPTSGLPDNILGIKLGMSKENAETRLKEIGKFSRDEEKNQQIWSLNNNPHFGYVAVGFDTENQVRYVAAFAKPKGGTLMRFDEVGDLKAAKEEVTGEFHRYTWEVPAEHENFSYSVIAQGNNSDYLSMFTLAKPQNKDEEEEEERERKERQN